MCFVHEGDWVARSYEEVAQKSDKPVKCLECFQFIPPGVEFTHIEMREYEECRRCQDENSERYEHCHPECIEGVHDYGEECSHRICDQCQKLLGAIQYVEVDDGCVGNETRPPLGELREVIRESDHAIEYIDRARQEYPELAMSGYLDRMYEITHQWEWESTERWDEDDIGPTDEPGGEG